MEVRFWGTRGSLPASVNAGSIRQKIRGALQIASQKGLGPDTDIDAFIDIELPFWIKGTYGTNTSCVEIREGKEFILCDAGSGIRDFGNRLLREDGRDTPKEYHILLSHPHWDHIQGFPFFVPALIKGNLITIYGCHTDLERAFSLQHSAPFFPLEFKDLEAEIRFVELVPSRPVTIAGFEVTPKEQTHPGSSYGYRLERGGKIIVYSTDSEHRMDDQEGLDSFGEFFSRADLLIFDAQYTLAEAWTDKKDWGHSNNVIGVELAQRAGVKRLCLFHQEPVSPDKHIDKLQQDTRRLVSRLGKRKNEPLEVFIAWDGMVVKV